MALFATGDNAGAMAQLLESIRIDRSWNEDAARMQLLNFSNIGRGQPRCDDRQTPAINLAVCLSWRRVLGPAMTNSKLR